MCLTWSDRESQHDLSVSLMWQSMTRARQSRTGRLPGSSGRPTPGRWRWSRPIDLGSGGGSIQPAVDPRGRGVLIWQQPNGQVGINIDASLYERPWTGRIDEHLTAPQRSAGMW